MSAINTIIFDLGGVLIDWNPAYVFDPFFDDEEKKKFFFENICTPDWNEQQDAGRKIQEATNELVAQYPGWEEAIRAYYGRWTEMLGGPIHETVHVFSQLKTNASLKFYALTNWSGELFPIALQRYEFLKWFDGIVVSGDEMTRKPFPKIYETLLSRFNINPEKALFIDDSLRNINAAEALGINCIHFQSAKILPQQLNEWSIAIE